MATYSKPAAYSEIAINKPIKATHLTALYDDLYDTIFSGGISSDQLASSAVIEAKIGASAVTNTKIADGAITLAKLSQVGGSEAVDTAAIRNGALSADVTGRAKMADEFVTFAKLYSGSVIAASGSYTGDGSSSRAVDISATYDQFTSVTPSIVFITRTAGSSGGDLQYRLVGMSANVSRRTGGGGDYTTAILSLDSGGFTIGSHTDVNESGSTYQYLAFGIKS